MQKNKSNKHKQTPDIIMRPIADLMASLAELTDGTVHQIRKTAEDPSRISVYDVLQLVTGCSANTCNPMFLRLVQNFPDVASICSNFKFSGRGQKDTPVTDARGIVDIIMALPGKAAGSVRRQAADVLVRYLGGDPTLVEEIAANRFTQEELSETDPNNSLRFFGQTIESEAIKRKREELTLLELEGRAKKARVEIASSVVRTTLESLSDLGLPISDRDKMLAKDIITTAAFIPDTGEREENRDTDICLQQFCAENGKPGKHVALGKKAKQLYLSYNPEFIFPKKTVFANGQMVNANRWTQSMEKYLEEALLLL